MKEEFDERSENEVWEALAKTANCLLLEEFEQLLVPQQEGNLNEAEYSRLMQHTKTCENCGALFAALNEGETIVKRAISKAVVAG